MDKNKITYVYADKLQRFKEYAMENRKDIQTGAEALLEYLKEYPDYPVIGVLNADYHAHDGTGSFYSFVSPAILGKRGWDKEMFWHEQEPSIRTAKKAIEWTLRGLPEEWESLPEEEILDLYHNVIPWTDGITVIMAC